ncbi:hypothetical protein [Streptomyces sp. CT34]|uniref:hypothetical protein n=1 Tax=Streptomyces sp. CT34 TaxID=1553907 RepID=UPI0005BB3F75|nr:hypothetical protein [Streptomyces sp. CT34]
MHLSDHFRFGTHPEHGFVATTANIPTHLAHWFLVREQFVPVLATPGLYRLTNPDQDGMRRTRQAVHDLRSYGYAVQADYSLDPVVTPGPPHNPIAVHGHGDGHTERRSRIAQAAAARSPQRGPALTTSPGARAIPPRPSYSPTVGVTQSTGGARGR